MSSWKYDFQCIVNIITVRATFGGNSYHPAEGLFKKGFAELLHSYCLGQDAFARLDIFYYSAITIVSFSR